MAEGRAYGWRPFRVRSLTDTSMMFMMPIPPTSKLMATIPAAIAVIRWPVCRIVPVLIDGLDAERVRVVRDPITASTMT